MTTIKTLIVLTLMFGLLSCASTSSIPPATLAVAQPLTAYRIQPGDTLDCKFFYNPELNETLTVRPDGRISLQLANDIMAAGLTPNELRDALMQHYKKEINKPEITIILRSFSAQRVYIDGEVTRPGMLPLAGSVTLRQAIAAAGGLRETAKQSDIIIIRRINGKASPFKVDLAALTADDPLLVPFDIVYVPRSAVAEVNTFVDLYIRRNLPVGLGVGFGWGN